MMPDDRDEALDTHFKALKVNLDPRWYGTFAEIGAGQEVTWRARHFGFPLTMTSRVTQVDFPRSFTDEQVRGPFRSFRHIHEFEATPGGCIMTDRVEFAAPFGLLGRAAGKLVLRPYLQRLIRDRGRFLAGIGS